MRKTVLAVLFSVFLFSGCSMFVNGPDEILKGDKIVCILYNQTDFKTALVKSITTSLEKNDFRVITDKVRHAKFYDSADYGAVVYMSEYWAWHTPFHAKRFFKKNQFSQNTLFVITSGNPDIEVHKPFDAVTCASRSNLVGSKSYEITERLKSILE